MFYSLIYTLLLLLFLVVVLFRPKYRKKYFANLRQRLGVGLESLNPENQPAIWVHAVSVGETLAIKSLVTSIKKEFPAYKLFVSTTTITGQETAKQHLEADGYFFAPFDWKWTIRKVLKAINPHVNLIVETELWPNLIKTLSSRGVPLVIVNGRISDRSFKGYKRFQWYIRPLLKRFRTILCQSEIDAQRYCQLGAIPEDVILTGNLKQTAEQYEVAQEKIADVKQRLCLDERPIFLAASIHKGEHEQVIAAWQKVRQVRADLRLVLVPRKPMEFEFFAEFLEQKNIAFGRFSDETERLNHDVVLIDAIGQLMALYHLADVSFVGGSFNEVGGHNLLEASAAGVACFFGPHMHNFRQVRQDVVDSGAGKEVADGEELAKQIQAVLEDEQVKADFREAALQLMTKSGSAIEKSLPHIEKALSEAGQVNFIPWYFRLASAAHKVAVRILKPNPARELAKAKKLDRPVISVGGLSFGGAGKTPLVELITSKLQEGDRQLCILSRGYKGKSKSPLLAADGSGMIESAARVGDEIVMLAKNLPDAMIVKDPDRYRGGLYAQEQKEIDLFVLDDGFQHRKLYCDVTILSINADSIVSPRYPSQLLREPLEYAHLADAIILQESTHQRTESARHVLQMLFPHIPVYKANFVLTDFQNARNEIKSIEQLQDEKLIAFCGIASPGRFISQLRSKGLNIVDAHIFPDHHNYSDVDVQKMLHSLKKEQAGAIITTAKDAVRWQVAVEYLSGIEVELIIARGSLQIDAEEDFFTLLKKKISP